MRELPQVGVLVRPRFAARVVLRGSVDPLTLGSRSRSATKKVVSQLVEQLRDLTVVCVPVRYGPASPRVSGSAGKEKLSIGQAKKMLSGAATGYVEFIHDVRS